MRSKSDGPGARELKRAKLCRPRGDAIRHELRKGARRGLPAGRQHRGGLAEQARRARIVLGPQHRDFARAGQQRVDAEFGWRKLPENLLEATILQVAPPSSRST